MVRVKYTLLVKIFAFVFFAFFILPAFLRLLGGPSAPKDHRPHSKNDDYGPISGEKLIKEKAPSRIGKVIVTFQLEFAAEIGI